MANERQRTVYLDRARPQIPLELQILQYLIKNIHLSATIHQPPTVNHPS